MRNARILFLVLGAALGVTLSGCPQLPPVSNCQPFTTRCDGNTPQVCSGSQRWTASQDTPCAAPTTCCWTADPYGGHTNACVEQDDCIQQP